MTNNIVFAQIRAILKYIEYHLLLEITITKKGKRIRRVVNAQMKNQSRQSRMNTFLKNAICAKNRNLIFILIFFLICIFAS